MECRATLKPRVRRLLRAFAMDVAYRRGQGNSLWYNAPDGREVEVLDLVGGYGALLFGHNHPALVAEAQQILGNCFPNHVQGSRRDAAESLARELARRAGGRFHVVFGNSGTEAVEAALKHAMLETGGRTFISLRQAFHGKTLGSLQLIGSDAYRDGFELCGLHAVRVQSGDVAALEAAFAEVEGLAGFVLEPIQGEGGVWPVDLSFAQRAAELCRNRGVPFIADECQTGLGRTGTFLACDALGVQPDYVLLAKALGGGLAKISALLIREERYVDSFDIKHSSTYAEDDYSSRIALKVLELLDEETLRDCRERGTRLLDQLRILQADFPEVIAGVRGVGLLLGVQFHGDRFSSVLLRMLAAQSDLGYLVSGYLFHQHRIRIAPTLSNPFTLRIEPSVLLDNDEIDRSIAGLRDVSQLLYAEDTASLTRFLLEADKTKPDHRLAPVRSSSILFSHRRVPLACATPRPSARVAWLCHLVAADSLGKLETSFAGASSLVQEAFLSRFAPFVNPIVMSETDIRSRCGDVLRFYPIMLPVSSRTVRDWMEQGERGMVQGLIGKGIETARSLNCSVLSLGQYTSIATAGGRSLAAPGCRLTNGNSYTVALVVRALRQASRALSRQPRHSVLAVVGAAGSIGAACAELLAGDYARTLLVGSKRRGSLARLRKLSSRVRRSEIAVDLTALGQADAVIVAVNSVDPLFSRNDFKPGAIVCDVSCPTAIAAAQPGQPDDFYLIDGGVAQLPHGEDLDIYGFPLPPGQVYGCMAEAMVMGFEPSLPSPCTSSLSTDQIQLIDSRAGRLGFELTGLPFTPAASASGRQRHVHVG